MHTRENTRRGGKWRGGETSEGVAGKLPARNLIPSFGDGSVKIRVEYSKTGNARYLSHLELMTAIVRALRRAGFQLKYSGGFHPSPKVSLGPALGVGIAGIKEYLDMEMTPPFNKESFLETFNRVLPEGIRANKIVLLDRREKSLNSFVVKYIYEIKSSKGLDSSGFSERKEILVERKEELIDMKKMVEETEKLDENTFRLTLRDQGELKVRLGELMTALFGVPAEELDITRLAVFGWNGTWSEPIENERVWAARS